MEKELLHKFFAGTATLEEKEAIMHWMESDPDNKQFLLKERKLYNAVLLHGEDKQVSATGRPDSNTSCVVAWPGS